MKQFILTKESLGLKEGTTFLEMSDGSYKNSTNTITLSPTIVENSKEFFKRIEDVDLWKPTQTSEAFFTITPDGGTLKLPWDEAKFMRMWQYGNVFRDENHATEASSAIAILLQTYQKKFNEFIAKHPKQPEVLQPQVQQPTPPVQPVGTPPPPPPMPPQPPMPQPPRYISSDDPRLSPAGVGNLFTTPGNER